MIAVKDMAYVRYQAPDLDAMERCLLDFGLHRVRRSDDALHMRSHGSAPFVHVTQRGPAASIGFGLIAGSADDLRHLAAETGKRVEPSDEPGGGLRVTLTDPAGLRVDVVHGQVAVQTLPVRAPMQRNLPGTPTRINRTVRTQPGPSQVLRAGHVALLVPDFNAAYDFYTRLLGMRLSDGYQAGPDEQTGRRLPALRPWRHAGRPPHRRARLAAGLAVRPHRPQRLRSHRPRRPDARPRAPARARPQTQLGLGRHVEGSQLFDYWRDPFGHKIEHWTDGDMVNDSYAPHRVPMDPGRLAQWAPPINAEFFE